MIPLLLALGLLAGACANDGDTVDLVEPDGAAVDVAAVGDETVAPTTSVSTTTSTTTTSTTTTTAAPAVWNLVGGGQIDPGSIEGQDTVLWFWAPW